MTPSRTLELLAPCRTCDIGIEAFKHGADAIYIGGPLFSARANAGNSMSEIERLASFAHRFNGRVYMALNTIFSDEELPEAVRLAHQAYHAGVDALIVQDMGLLMCDLPPIQLHASTQCDIRTTEKAVFLESIGFSQIVPARELTLGQIQEMAEALKTARIEFFIHGALCVSYSGQCYASQAFKGRSANRGDCAQICRLPFDLFDEEGKSISRGKHLLSLKDNNQSQNLDALIAAGVRSFKIEGRYKDLTYVKNTTAFYRRELDTWLEKHPDFEAESDGKVEFNFEPSLENAFNRGATDYFVNGRSDHMEAFSTPKNSGAVIGQVVKVNDRSFLVKTKKELHNGDGLTFFTDTDELSGLLINRAEQKDTGLWEVFTREPCSRITGLKEGLRLMRNKDAAWLKRMNAETALRKIPIRIEASVRLDGIDIRADDGHGHQSEVTLLEPLPEAKNPQAVKNQVLRALGKLGSSDFIADDITIEGEHPGFMSASVLNGLRRELIARLEEDRSQKREILPQAKEDTKAVFPVKELDYHGNVMNKKALEFYRLHGTQVTEPAFEKGQHKGETEVMRCRYCIRHALDICPKQGKLRGEKIKPTPLKLRSGKIELTAHFHCKPCEMSLITKV